MLELDDVVKRNQLACLPIAKGEEVMAELLAVYPELRESIERSRRIRLDMISLQTRLYERESKASSAAKARADLLEDFETPVPVQKSRRKSSGERESHTRSPGLKAKKSNLDLMFEMDSEVSDEEGQDVTSTHSRRHVSTPGTKSPMLSASLASDEGVSKSPMYFDESHSPVPLRTPPRDSMVPSDSVSPHGSISTRLAWAGPQFSAPKSNMKEIMAQASSTRISSISSGLSAQARGKEPASTHMTPNRISQRERKRNQHAQPNKSAPALTEAAEAIPVQTDVPRPASSPWQVASRGSKVNLKSVLEDTEVISPSSTQEAPRTPSPMTMRQTVAGRPPQAQGTISGPPALSRGEESHPSPSAKHVTPAARATSFSSVSSPQMPAIKSIRHIPPQTAEPSLQLPMADILAQQQTEKQIVKDAAAKKSLQEIQQEQAFQEWWDQESAKVKQEAEDAEKSASRKASGSDGRRGRGKRRGGASDGRGRGKSKEGGDREAGGSQEAPSTVSKNRRGRAYR